MRKKKNNCITLDFVSNLKLTEFCVLVFTFLKNTLGIDEDDFFRIEIALREVINNAIIHGNKSDRNKRVYVKFEWNRKSLKMRVKDENPEYVDFDAIRKKLEENDLLSYNGRGLMLMRSYMDKVEFKSSSKKKGTEIVMVKNL